MTRNQKKTIGFALLAAAAFMYFRKKSTPATTTTVEVYTPGAPPVNAQPADGSRFETIDAGNLGIFGTKNVFI